MLETASGLVFPFSRFPVFIGGNFLECIFTSFWTLPDLREEIESEVLEMQSHLDKIYNALRPLEDLYPDEDEYWEEEE